VIESGACNCVLALGFEKMQRGSLSSTVSNNLTQAVLKNPSCYFNAILFQVFGSLQPNRETC